ncbi:ABC transporter permease [Xylanibacillus composti]|uniref:Putative ABC transporter permease protein YtlD n=1 Tax=Xylanibacillus composti TaxID=1572762 RepID=A0A8J4H4A9_9BACL|nr:ABC transporter permease [Xylanibacillus composti]MDT9724202.1 ABC transporter permease [Xylanibacillus composti]GIQ68283.1 putative ABC transporter permease protein YtlD [Xylanibacillus composti]
MNSQPKPDPAALPLADQVYHDYRKRKRQERIRVILVQLATLVSLLALWEIAGRRSWIDVLLFSYPSKIGNLLLEKLMDGSLLPHVGITVMETVIGFILGTLCGTAAATLLWWSPFLSKVLDPYIVVLNSMPKVALGPLLIVGLGPGMPSIIAMTLAVTVIITTLVVYSSFKEVDPNYVKVVLLYGANRAGTFANVIFPASLPTIISTLKVNVGLSWIGVIVGEFLVSKQGLGYLIIYGFQVFNFTLVIGSLAIIAIVATLMYQAVSFLESALMRRR